jgi:glycosyltransferase involved in cell wall biosynthesis
MDAGLEDRPLRILHCFRSPVGGIFRHVRDLTEEHASRGHQVGILCDSTTGGAYEDGLFDTIRPHLALGLTRLPIRRAIGPSDIKAALAAFSEIKSLQPDIVHGHGAKGGAYARIIGSRLRVSRSRVARFYSPHGGSLHFDASRPSGRLFFAIERQLERWTDRILFVSDYERRAYADKVGAPRVPFVLVPNGLRDGEFDPVATDDDARDFLYIGMMRDLKGPDVFIDTLAKAEKIAGRPIYAHMVGDGDDKPRYADMIAAHGLADRVTLHAAMPARAAFAKARTVVIPSRAESMPYIVLEAAAAARPLIASRVGGIPEILGRDYEGLVAPGQSDALAEAMVRAVQESDWPARAMPAQAGLRATFSAKAMAAKVLSTYRATLDEMAA